MALNGQTVADMIRDALKADTTLYGTNGNRGLVNKISSSRKEFEKASVNRTNKNYALYLKASPVAQTRVGMQIQEELYTIDYRVSGYSSDLDKAYTRLAEIDKAMRDVINTQMHDGSVFTEYYTDTLATVKDVEITESSPEIAEREGSEAVEIDGSLNVFVVRLEG